MDTDCTERHRLKGRGLQMVILLSSSFEHFFSAINQKPGHNRMTREVGEEGLVSGYY